MLTRRAGRLSGGERKMLAMGRVLMLQPALFLLDEPTANLAPQVAAELLSRHVRTLPGDSSWSSSFASMPLSFQSARGPLEGWIAPRETSSNCGRLAACRAAVSATSRSHPRSSVPPRELPSRNATSVYPQQAWRRIT
jgi:hypothetical protein